jgi:hypothetical protein
MSGTLKYNYCSTIFGGNIGDDNIIHPSESRNFISKAYREFAKKNHENKDFSRFRVVVALNIFCRVKKKCKGV